MKKILVATLLSLLVASSAFAVSTVGFRAYSTATAMSCSVMAGESMDSFFSPFVGNSVLLSLGTKGTGTYTVKNNDFKLYAICFPTVAGLDADTTARTTVKMFFNGVESFYFPGYEFKLNVK